MSVEWILFKTAKKYSPELLLKRNSHQCLMKDTEISDSAASVLTTPLTQDIALLVTITHELMSLFHMMGGVS